MSIKAVYDYVVKYFGLDCEYKVFWGYVRRRKLDWFMPAKGGSNVEQRKEG